MRDKELLLENLYSVISLIKRKRKVVTEIKQQLVEHHGIMSGSIQEWLTNPEKNLEGVDIRELYLLTEQLYLKTGNMDIRPDEFFTNVEKKEARIYHASVKRSVLDFPLTFNNAIKVGSNAYSVPISIRMLDEMMDNMLIDYDPELQREMVVKQDMSGNIRYEPTLIKKNVDEISEHLLNGTLVPTTLVLNAALGSSESGEELVYDSKTASLTVTNQTKLAVVDGFHRIRGSQVALRRNSELDFNFVVIITNYSKPMAKKYQYQLSQATPISAERAKQLKGDRHSDPIVNRLQVESDLKDRISQKGNIKPSVNQLVSYNLLADSIDNYFSINSNKDAKNVGSFLIEFFDELIGSFPEEFITNVSETRKESIINENNMFIGYTIIANKLYQENLPAEKIVSIVNSIDFKRNNKEWIEANILDENGNFAKTDKARDNIAKYFKSLDILEMVG
ncbi:DNA sulfur modification protein DndB [Rossellomorea marisflavi]|uniref:DNA sulfur modification protein DndB n=1 Tax=Rossellomorea marisflavi TaxID=189381 RepID=UPI00345DFD2A